MPNVKGMHEFRAKRETHCHILPGWLLFIFRNKGILPGS